MVPRVKRAAPSGNNFTFCRESERQIHARNKHTHTHRHAPTHQRKVRVGGLLPDLEVACLHVFGQALVQTPLAHHCHKHTHLHSSKLPQRVRDVATTQPRDKEDASYTSRTENTAQCVVRQKLKTGPTRQNTECIVDREAVHFIHALSLDILQRTQAAKRRCAKEYMHRKNRADQKPTTNVQ